MTKNTTQEAAAAAESLLLDDWFDAIEDGVRARVRGFIETMLEAELSEALSRPRYGRRRLGESLLRRTRRRSGRILVRAGRSRDMSRTTVGWRTIRMSFVTTFRAFARRAAALFRLTRIGN